METKQRHNLQSTKSTWILPICNRLSASKVRIRNHTFDHTFEIFTVKSANSRYKASLALTSDDLERSTESESI